MKMLWQTIASNVSIRTISPTATPLPKACDCVAVYIAGRRTNLVVYGWRPKPPTKKDPFLSGGAWKVLKQQFLDWTLNKTPCIFYGINCIAVLEPSFSIILWAVIHLQSTIPFGVINSCFDQNHVRLIVGRQMANWIITNSPLSKFRYTHNEIYIKHNTVNMAK